MRSSIVLIPLLAALAACADRPNELAGPAEHPAPLLTASGATPATDRYIVVFRDDVADPAALADQLLRANGGTRGFVYQYALKGFAASLPAQALDAIRRNPNVQYVEEDGIATVDGSPEALTSAQWGLDRVDQRPLTRDNLYYYENEGPNVEAYILDTGIRYTHQEFGGRAVSGHDYVDNDDLSQDCHGHGTHVAGTVGGATVGLAKSVKLIGVRVLNCSGSGSYSGIVAAVDGITRQKQARPSVPMVGNMSLGGGVSSSLNTAVNNSVDAGVVWAVAAGNDNGDACLKSPASAVKALTVGASTSTDARSSFSNWGSCVDLFAPGSSIYSSTYNGDNTYASWSGTSMASPHVAGGAALWLSAHPTATALEANAAIVAGTTRDVLTGVNGSPNYLLYTLIAGSSPPPPPPPPPPSLTIHVADLDGSASLSKRNWSASVDVLVKDASGNPVAGVAVSGSWSGAASGSGSCTTDAAGWCSVSKGGLKTSRTSITFTVSSLSLTGAAYNAAANQDPDGGSNGTSITINKP